VVIAIVLILSSEDFDLSHRGLNFSKAGLLAFVLLSKSIMVSLNSISSGLVKNSSSLSLARNSINISISVIDPHRRT
jgi:hypothetical protein